MIEETLAVISTKGQLAIPKAVRDALKLREGTQVMLAIEGTNCASGRLTTGGIYAVCWRV